MISQIQRQKVIKHSICMTSSKPEIKAFIQTKPRAMTWENNDQYDQSDEGYLKDMVQVRDPGHSMCRKIKIFIIICLYMH